MMLNFVILRSHLQKLKAGTRYTSTVGNIPNR